MTNTQCCQTNRNKAQIAVTLHFNLSKQCAAAVGGSEGKGPKYDVGLSVFDGAFPLECGTLLGKVVLRAAHAAQDDCRTVSKHDRQALAPPAFPAR